MTSTSRIAHDTTHAVCKRIPVFWLLTAIGASSVLGASLVSASDAAVREEAAVRTIPASVSTIASGGLWGERGSYRIVVTEGGFEHIQSEVYAQWLDSNDEGEARVEESVRVKALSQLVFAVVGDVRIASASAKSQGVFEIDLVDRNTQKKSVAILKLGKPGEASVEMPPAERVE